MGTGDIQRFCQLGPLTRRSEDLWPLLVAMKTPPPASTPVEVEVEVPAGGVKAADKSGREKVADCSSDSDGSSEEEVGGGDVCFPEGQLLQLSSPELLQVRRINFCYMRSWKNAMLCYFLRLCAGWY